MESQTSSGKERSSTQSSDEQFFASAPAVTLPKGGGAIRGIGEKFAANPVTGTGSMTIPIPTSPGRGGFGPQLSLSYDSSAGNGPFGFGWSLSTPSIVRKTDKGLPQYHDADESDVFILAGAEDLVPVLTPDDVHGWIADQIERDSFLVRRYRPRVEGLFARIERWTDIATGEAHWRSITRDNVTSLYGRDNNSRIFDPADPDPSHPTRIFRWLLCESYDDKGNAILFEYKEENSDNVDASQVCEANRTTESRSSNRYLKRIRYGNKSPRRSGDDLASRADWMFEVVLDYGEHYFEDDNGQPSAVYLDDDDVRLWEARRDPFSSYRASFEVRTHRLCRRVLMFHHFDELDIDPYLVRATEFAFDEQPIAAFMTAVTQSGFRWDSDAKKYLKKALPPLEFEYSKAIIDDRIFDINEASLENLPHGVDGSTHQWIDLDGEGLPGLLTEQGASWFYKPNLSPVTYSADGSTTVELDATRPVGRTPNAALQGGRAQFLDLAGDGQLDVVQLDDVMAGFYERSADEDWVGFTSFSSRPNLIWTDPNLKFIDLTGDGHADILVGEDDVFTWYPSESESGFGPGVRVRQAHDPEEGPRLIFADGTQSVYLADMCGDGLSDLVRIRNGEICYWSNRGYGRFGTKVTMGSAPWFDNAEQFDQRRIRLADIDGSGATDIIYLGVDGVRVYFNQSGNTWSPASELSTFPHVDSLSHVSAVDLLGNGTACLVWSSPLSGDARRAMRYVSLMKEGKPHLLVKVVNNLGAETHVTYAPSTRFYLEDKRCGTPWLTRLPFPVHVIERVETLDRISGNRFVTRYRYHHGYFDGEEREFRGFAMVEQFDTEEIDANASTSESTNFDATSFVPPVHTKTWFHTGAYFEGDTLSRQLAAEYYDAPGDDDAASVEEFLGTLLDDTLLPGGLNPDEEREACRALRGLMLRQEVYGLDGTAREPYPYAITEQNFSVRLLQPQHANRHAVFLSHPREALSYRFERQPDDARIGHAMTLEVDEYGTVLKAVAIGYGRESSPLDETDDRTRQTRTLITYTENEVTNAIDDAGHPDAYRAPLPSASRTYELHADGSAGGYVPTSSNGLFQISDFVEQEGGSLRLISTGVGEIPYEEALTRDKTRRVIEHARTHYRANDLSRLLPLGELESLALPGEAYKLAFTPGLLTKVYRRTLRPAAETSLLPTPSDILAGTAGDQGGYVEVDGGWWMPSGRVYFDTAVDRESPADTAAAELSEAERHFFQPRLFTNPFGSPTTVEYDTYDLLPIRTTDAVDNTVSATPDYRVLQAATITDPNDNRTAVAFDALGLVVATALMGKATRVEGDRLANLDADPSLSDLQAFVADPHAQASTLLATSTTRIVYDVDRFRRCGQPAFAATIARETHYAEPGGDTTKRQISFSYSDGFGREIQKKIQAETGVARLRAASVETVTGDLEPGELLDTLGDTLVRWVGNGRTVYNNKGKPVRVYEPFFSATHLYEQESEMTDAGVSSIHFYDPAERVVATRHPDYAWDKVTFDPWQVATYDVNDTVTDIDGVTDPALDPEVGGYFERLPDDEYLPTWYDQRMALPAGDRDRIAAEKTAVHRQTPTVAHFDSLGRAFMTVAHNRFERDGEIVDETYASRIDLDIEGNQRVARDAVEQAGDAMGRIVMTYEYDMLGNRIHQASMEAGQRWMLSDVLGNVIRAWDSRGHDFRTEYDALRRPRRQFVRGTDARSDPRTLVDDVCFAEVTYGENRPNDRDLNLRTRVFETCDSAGKVTHGGLNPATNQTEAYDFKGNLLRSSRQLAQDYAGLPDWSVGVTLVDEDVFESSTTYDALNRPITMTSPDMSVVRPVYNEANLLNAVSANLRGATDATAFVTNIDYNERGQRVQIEYGNGVTTSFEYDKRSFRLTHLLTRRNAATFPDDCPSPAVDGWPGCQVQNLHYTYDPAGNITFIRDDAQQTIYFRNRRVEPSNDYTYDALYRLIEATGREHLGQVGGSPIVHSYNDSPRVGIDWSANDGNAMGSYTETYVYDAVGNFLEMRHRGSDATLPGWTRTYAYEEASLIENGTSGGALKTSNRLSRTVPNPNGTLPINEVYGHDDHGNMTKMPQLAVMSWDFKDQLIMTQRQAVSATDADGAARQGERTYYVYDGSGQRVRKVTETDAGGFKDERVYLGPFEIYRSSGTNALTRETLQIMEGVQRVALIETRVTGQDSGPQHLIRYQFGNHLSSVNLELDETSKIISYEEYAPYGTSTYQCVTSHVLTSKRYRFSGKERDDESGLNYHGLRYYAGWLGRWTRCDPAGLVDGSNVYAYVRNRPTVCADPSGQWSWGRVLGIAAAVVVGVAVTAFTGGIVGPIAAGIIGGMVGGAMGEIVEAAVDGRPITAPNVLTAAAVGGAAGGLFAGAGQLIANTGIGRAIASQITRSAVGQAVSRAAYSIATSNTRAAAAARAAGAVARKGVTAMEEAGEETGRRMGGPFARNAVAQAERRAGLAAARADAEENATRGVQSTLRGEIDGKPISATTRSGIDRSGTGLNAIETAEGRSQAPSFDQLPAPLAPLTVRGSKGESFARGADAEIKLFGHLLLKTPSDSTGRLYLGVNAPMCPSCSANLWSTRSALPGLQIVDDMPSPAAGTSGALDRLIQPNNSDVPPPMLQLEVSF